MVLFMSGKNIYIPLTGNCFLGKACSFCAGSLCGDFVVETAAACMGVSV